MLNIDIDSFIPHRKKIKIIGDILDVQEKTAVSSACVDSDWPLCDGSAVDSLVLIEAIAQTAAVIEGYKRSQRGKSGAKGWLVGVKNAEFYVDKVPLNTNLIISIESKHAFDNYGVIEGTIKAGEKILAVATLQAMLMNEEDK